MRIGHGFDVHQLGDTGRLILAGVVIPYSKGFLAHSDGDVVLHACIDALLGAAALGDIGRLFPDTDPAYAGIDSRILLRQAYQHVVEKGYCLGNLDVTILAQKPKISGYISQMQANLAEDLHTSIDNINVKATTTEQLGFVGRGEGIACEAVVLLFKGKK